MRTPRGGSIEVLAGGRLSPRPVAGGVSRSPVLGRADQIKGNTHSYDQFQNIMSKEWHDSGVLSHHARIEDRQRT